MKKILLAVDRDGLAESVVPAVAALASEPGAEVLVVHVVDPAAPDASWWDAAHVLSDVVLRLAQDGIKAEGQARDGRRREVAVQIAAAAREINADLIALGSHGRGDIGGLLLGSVGHKVAALTTAPLLVARPTPGAESARHLAKIVVAVDRSPETGPAVDLALDIARGRTVEVRLVHAMNNVVAEGGAYLEPDEEAEVLLEQLAGRFRAAGVRVSTEILDGFGPLSTRIADAAAGWAADLVVVGSRRLGELSALVQGSTSHGLIAEADRPVLVAGRPRPA